MATRDIRYEMELAEEPERVFALLHTPSAIRGWWSAARAVVIPRPGGVWAAAWGSDENDPDYMGIARIADFDPPRRMVLADYEYYAKTGPLPFQADLTTEFTVLKTPVGSLLCVCQAGFPVDSCADDFYQACIVGWRDTFDGIRNYLALAGRAAPVERAGR